MLVNYFQKAGFLLAWWERAQKGHGTIGIYSRQQAALYSCLQPSPTQFYL